VDDQISTTLRTSSAIAKASAVNDFSEFTGVKAYVNETSRAGSASVAGGTLDENNFIKINDVVFTGFTVQQDDANESLLNAFNAELSNTGVLASRNDQGQIELTAADGRNIDVEVVGNGGIIGGLASDVTTSTITLVSDEQFQLGGTNEASLGFVDNAITAVTNRNSVANLSVEGREEANLALLVLDRAISQISSDRSELGAVQNRLQSTISNLSSVAENATAARSRILDADFASESAQLSRNQILTQAATTILAQANQVPQQAMSLLQ
jgi:flagellin